MSSILKKLAKTEFARNASEKIARVEIDVGVICAVWGGLGTLGDAIGPDVRIINYGWNVITSILGRVTRLGISVQGREHLEASVGYPSAH
jgi:hypothetical protein